MRKFNRVYELRVETGPGFFTSPLRDATATNAHVSITLPFAIEFEICRESLIASQTATFRIYNLPEETRSAIGKDRYQLAQYRSIQFWAGYSNETGHSAPMVFNGTVLRCYSYKDAENWITEIDASDGGYQIANATNFVLSATSGLSAGEAIQIMAQSLPRMFGVPIVGSFPTTNKRGEVYVGSTWGLIQKKSNGMATIDSGQLKALTLSECFNNAGLPIIDDSTGLIGTPRLADTVMEMKMVFEPALTVGQIIDLRVSSLPKLKRYWKVLGFRHSANVALYGEVGEAVTRVQLFYNQEDLDVVGGQPFLNPILIT